jgi:hypothetical protein
MPYSPVALAVRVRFVMRGRHARVIFMTASLFVYLFSMKKRLANFVHTVV